MRMRSKAKFDAYFQLSGYMVQDNFYKPRPKKKKIKDWEACVVVMPQWLHVVVLVLIEVSFIQKTNL